MLDGLAGVDVSRYILAIVVVGLGLLCLIGVMWFIRNRPSSPFIRGGRSRQPRLAVVDATAVDARRRIILVRRDNVEHLIMIGGPTDIVIESRISGAVDSLTAFDKEPQAQQSFDKPENPLELPSPPLRVTEQVAAPSAQTQQAPPLKAKMWPTEPKPSEPPLPPAPIATDAAEPLAFQPPAPSLTAVPLPNRIKAPLPPEPSKPVQMAAPLVVGSKRSATDPDLEIRNPYLEDDDDTAPRSPTPARFERPSTTPSTPATQPMTSAPKWPAPLQSGEKREPFNNAVTSEPAPVAAAMTGTRRMPDWNGRVTQEANLSVSQPKLAEPVSLPDKDAGKAGPAETIDVDDLISGDFLDAARSRVLSPEPKPNASVSGVASSDLANTQPAQTPIGMSMSAPIATATSAFAKILEDEIKTGLPDARFDKPRVEPAMVATKPVSIEPRRWGDPIVNDSPRATMPTAPATVSAPSDDPLRQSALVVEDARSQAAEVDVSANKSVADIFDAARSRVLEPAAPELTKQDEKLPEPIAVTVTGPDAVQSELTDAFALEFEKIWEKQSGDIAPSIELDAVASNSPVDTLPAPDVRFDPQTEQKPAAPDIFGRDLRRDPFLDDGTAQDPFAEIDKELSLDDEMARVLGEFSITRKK